MGSLQDLKTYVNAAATGMLSSSGFIWLVTDALGHLGVIATYGAGTLLVNERRQSLSPDGNTELGGMYVPAENPAPTPTPAPTSTPTPTPNTTQSPTSPASGLATPPLRTSPPQGARALSTTMPTYGSRDRVSHPPGLWSEGPYNGGTVADADAGAGGGVNGMLGTPNGSSSDLYSLGRALYPLFCVSVHEHAWMAAGYGVWGREKYMERFWTCLDWAAVRDAYAQYARPKY
jgi:Fe-Mn family superoxide dismutase